MSKELEVIKSYREGFVQTKEWVNAINIVRQKLMLLDEILGVVRQYDINDVNKAQDYMQLIIGILINKQQLQSDTLRSQQNVGEPNKEQYVLTEYCKKELKETLILDNLTKSQAHTLRELLNSYANKDNKVRYKCYDNPNVKEQLRDEIISELNEELSPFNFRAYNDRFIGRVNNHTTEQLEVIVCRGKFYTTEPISAPLASKIIKYFELEEE